MKTVMSMFVAVLFLAIPAIGIEIEFVEIRDVGNAAYSNGRGSVAYEYRIGKYEVTTTQYTAFLNAIAKSDPRQVWNSNQSITRSGTSGSYVYSTKAGFENRPMDYVQLRDCMRFVNWLHNGQPTGAQDATTTEDGAYDFKGTIDPTHSTARESDWKYALPNLDEWFKAAYYNRATASYFKYPTSSDTAPGHIEGAIPNNACFVSPPKYLDETNTQDVASYTASASPYGTYDQAGNASERTETITSTAPDALTTLELGGRYSAAPSSFHIDTVTNNCSLLHYKFHKGYGLRVVATALPPARTVVIIR